MSRVMIGDGTHVAMPLTVSQIVNRYIAACLDILRIRKPQGLGLKCTGRPTDTDVLPGEGFAGKTCGLVQGLV